MLIVLAEKHSQHGYIDWKNVANKVGHGMTNTQCRDRWNYLLLQGKVIIDEAELTTCWYTPDPDYDYTDDVMQAFKVQRKKTSRKSTVWTPEMV